MGQTTPSQYIIGIIMFTMVIVGGIALINIYKNEGAAFANTAEFAEFNDTFNLMDDVESTVDDLQSNVEEEDADYGLVGEIVNIADTLINGLWNTLKLLASTLGFMNAAYTGLSDFFGVPVWATALIIMIVTVVIIFSIIGALFQRDL